MLAVDWIRAISPNTVIGVSILVYLYGVIGKPEKGIRGLAQVK